MIRYTFGFLWAAGLFALMIVCGCAAAPLDAPRIASFAFRSPQETELGRAVEWRAAEHPGESGLLLLPTGPEALVARVVLASVAQKSLDLQYFIFEDDLVGSLLLDRVLASADRGVRVRLLLDDFYQVGRDRRLAAIDSHPNIEVRVFNPVGSFRSSNLSRPMYYAFGPKRIRGRMHNKMMLADGAAVVVGGRNMADEYFGARAEFNYADQDLLAIGPATRDASYIFDQYWSAPIAIPITAFAGACPASLDEVRAAVARRVESGRDSVYAQSLRDSPLLKQILAHEVPWIWAEAEVLADHPGKALLKIKEQPSAFMATRLMSALDCAQREVLMVSPYLVPGKQGMDWFRRARDRGVDVKVITNSLASTDVVAVQGGYQRYRNDMLRAGVELFELRPDPDHSQADLARPGAASRAALHAKVLVLDREWVFVGSFNLDPRSSRLDTQDGILVHSPELAAQMAARFEKGASSEYTYRVTLDERGLTWTSEKEGRQVEYHHEPGTSVCRRLKASLLGLLAPEPSL